MAARRKGTMEDDLVDDDDDDDLAGRLGVDFEIDVSFGKSKTKWLRDERVGSSMVENCASSLLPMVMSLGGCGGVPLGDGRPGMSKPDDVSCRNEKKNINKFSE